MSVSFREGFMTFVFFSVGVYWKPWKPWPTWKLSKWSWTLFLGIDDRMGDLLTCERNAKIIVSAFVVYCWFRRWPQKNNTITKHIKETPWITWTCSILSIIGTLFHLFWVIYFQFKRTTFTPVLRGWPWKINGWNLVHLQPSPMKRKEQDLNQTSMII